MVACMHTGMSSRSSTTRVALKRCCSSAAVSQRDSEAADLPCRAVVCTARQTTGCLSRSKKMFIHRTGCGWTFEVAFFRMTLSSTDLACVRPCIVWTVKVSSDGSSPMPGSSEQVQGFITCMLNCMACAQPGVVWTMKFSKNGKYLATAGQDAIVRVWEVVLHRDERGMPAACPPAPGGAREDGSGSRAAASGEGEAHACGAAEGGVGEGRDGAEGGAAAAAGAVSFASRVARLDNP